MCANSFFSDPILVRPRSPLTMRWGRRLPVRPRTPHLLLPTRQRGRCHLHTFHQPRHLSQPPRNPICSTDWTRICTDSQHELRPSSPRNPSRGTNWPRELYPSSAAQTAHQPQTGCTSASLERSAARRMRGSAARCRSRSATLRQDPEVCCGSPPQRRTRHTITPFRPCPGTASCRPGGRAHQQPSRPRLS